jgi:hypothetical protein
MHVISTVPRRLGQHDDNNNQDNVPQHSYGGRRIGEVRSTVIPKKSMSGQENSSYE